jgi:hypothetical protein
VRPNTNVQAIKAETMARFNGCYECDPVSSGHAVDKSGGSRQSQTNEPATAENAGLRSEMEGGEGKQQRQGSRCLQQTHERLSQERVRAEDEIMRASVRGGEFESSGTLCCR